jgi:hypothetical protein
MIDPPSRASQDSAKLKKNRQFLTNSFKFSDAQWLLYPMEGKMIYVILYGSFKLAKFVGKKVSNITTRYWLPCLPWPHWVK